jgi:hypothetical protein
VLNYLSTTPWRSMGKWRYRSTIRDLDTRWRWMVRFMPRSLHPQGYPLDTKLGGPQNRYGRCWIQKSLPSAGNQTSSLQPLACRYTDSQYYDGSVRTLRAELWTGTKQIRIGWNGGSVWSRMGSITIGLFANIWGPIDRSEGPEDTHRLHKPTGYFH